MRYRVQHIGYAAPRKLLDIPVDPHEQFRRVPGPGEALSWRCEASAKRRTRRLNAPVSDIVGSIVIATLAPAVPVTRLA